MSEKNNTLLKLLHSEKEKLEEKIEVLSREKEDISREIEKTRLDKLTVGLNQEKEELAERIESLSKEKEDIIKHLKIAGIIKNLKCPKDFQCYKGKNAELCKAEFVNDLKVLQCFENKHGECMYSLSYEEQYYCQCPLRNYIAKNMENERSNNGN